MWRRRGRAGARTRREKPPDRGPNRDGSRGHLGELPQSFPRRAPENGPVGPTEWRRASLQWRGATTARKVRAAGIPPTPRGAPILGSDRGLLPRDEPFGSGPLHHEFRSVDGTRAIHPSAKCFGRSSPSFSSCLVSVQVVDRLAVRPQPPGHPSGGNSAIQQRGGSSLLTPD